VVARWPEAVGPSIARNAWPARIARDGTLHVSTADSVWAFELGHNAAEIASRIGVTSIRFAPGPLPRHEPEATTPPPVQPTAEHEREAATLAAPIEHDEVRRTVQKAVLFGLARAAGNRPV
jgi:hypothetical protein